MTLTLHPFRISKGGPDDKDKFTISVPKNRIVQRHFICMYAYCAGTAKLVVKLMKIYEELTGLFRNFFYMSSKCEVLPFFFFYTWRIRIPTEVPNSLNRRRRKKGNKLEASM